MRNRQYCYAAGNSDIGKRGATIERILPDACYAVWYGDADEGRAVYECRIANASPLLGRVMLFRPQPANSYSPMLVTPPSRVTLVSDVQPVNVQLPRFVTLAGTVTLTRDKQPSNA